MAALFSARSFKEDGISAMSCVLILGIAAGSVALVEALPSTYTAIDISRDQTTSISGDTAEHLSELDCDVEVYLVAEEGSEDEYVERMLDQYAQASDRVTVEQVDPALHPTFTDQYTSEDVADGSIIVVVDDASCVVSSSDLYTLNYSTFSYEFAGESAIITANIDLLETVDGENQWTRSTHRQAERLSELIGDLIELARADEPGGVSLTLTRARRDAELTVRNPCVGLDASETDRLFERFYRPDPSRERGTGGYGIGLSIARSVTERHGGKIRAKKTATTWRSS